MLLSIESSCDDSSVAITKIDTKEVVFHKKISQEIEHSVYGGVVPELAARLHAKALPDILAQAKEFFPYLKAVAVTNEPGLSVTLVEGVVMAKALSSSLNIPLIPINHLKGHIYSLFIEKDEDFPLLVLLVSGGHTQFLHVKSSFDIELIASTLDDSFGESFDKVAKMMGLGYPGGAKIEALAKNGDENRFNFTIPLRNYSDIAFSYSGLKNQVRLCIEELGELTYQDTCDIAASFQRVAIAHIIWMLKRLLKKRNFSKFAVVGGASANLTLRNELQNIFSNVLIAPLQFCSDNAVMIGRAALSEYEAGNFCSISDIRVNPKTSF